MPRYITFENIQNVTGSCCHGLIEAALAPHEKTLHIDIKNCVYHFDGENKSATIVIDDKNELTDEELEQHLRVILSDYLPAGDTTTKKNNYHALQAFIGLSLGSLFMLLMWQAVELANLHLIMTSVGAIVTLVIGRASFYKAWLGLKRWKFNMDSLFTMSAFAAVFVSLVHVTVLNHYLHGLPMLIDAPLMIFGFRHFGLWLRELFVDKIQKREKFVHRARQSTFEIKRGVAFVPYEPSSIKPHERFKDISTEMGKQDIIRIQPGECIPLNGVLLDDTAEVTFAVQTGQLDPIQIQKNKKLFAGMIVAGKPIVMKVTHSEIESYLHARDISLIKAKIKKAPIQDMADTISQYFAPGAFIAAIAWGAMAWYFQGMATGIGAGLYVAVCMCPCALGLVTPLAIGITMSKVRDKGYHFNTEKGVQAASAVNTVIFDLNGTLTKNQPKVILSTVDSRDLAVLYAMESKSAKPIAKAICDDAVVRLKNMPSITITEIYTEHNGIRAVVDGSVYEVGNEDFFKNLGLPLIEDMGNAQHVIYYKKNGQSLGYMLIEDPLREDAPWVIESLKKNNIDVKIASGASASTIERYLAPLGLTAQDVLANCDPAAKTNLVTREKNKGRTVAMFGDSGNDCDAIAAAHLGVVVNSPSTDPMTTQSADASINTANLYPVLEMLALGKQSMRLIYTNLFISFSYNVLSLGFVGYAAFCKPSWLNPSWGAGSMVAQTMCLLVLAFGTSLIKARLPVVVPQVQKPDQSQTLRHSPTLNTPKKTLRFTDQQKPTKQEEAVHYADYFNPFNYSVFKLKKV